MNFNMELLECLAKHTRGTPLMGGVQTNVLRI
jgi:hypothetical protein